MGNELENIEDFAKQHKDVLYAVAALASIVGLYLFVKGGSGSAAATTGTGASSTGTGSSSADNSAVDSALATLQKEIDAIGTGGSSGPTAGNATGKTVVFNYASNYGGSVAASTSSETANRTGFDLFAGLPGLGTGGLGFGSSSQTASASSYQALVNDSFQNDSEAAGLTGQELLQLESFFQTVGGTNSQNQAYAAAAQRANIAAAQAVTGKANVVTTVTTNTN